jgi:hypothetical protein
MILAPSREDRRPDSRPTGAGRIDGRNALATGELPHARTPSGVGRRRDNRRFAGRTAASTMDERRLFMEGWLGVKGTR